MTGNDERPGEKPVTPPASSDLSHWPAPAKLNLFLPVRRPVTCRKRLSFAGAGQWLRSDEAGGVTGFSPGHSSLPVIHQQPHAHFSALQRHARGQGLAGGGAVTLILHVPTVLRERRQALLRRIE